MFLVVAELGITKKQRSSADGRRKKWKKCTENLGRVVRNETNGRAGGRSQMKMKRFRKKDKGL